MTYLPVSLRLQWSSSLSVSGGTGTTAADQGGKVVDLPVSNSILTCRFSRHTPSRSSCRRQWDQQSHACRRRGRYPPPRPLPPPNLTPTMVVPVEVAAVSSNMLPVAHSWAQHQDAVRQTRYEHSLKSQTRWVLLCSPLWMMRKIVEVVRGVRRVEDVVVVLAHSESLIERRDDQETRARRHR